MFEKLVYEANKDLPRLFQEAFNAGVVAGRKELAKELLQSRIPHSYVVLPKMSSSMTVALSPAASILFEEVPDSLDMRVTVSAHDMKNPSQSRHYRIFSRKSVPPEELLYLVKRAAEQAILPIKPIQTPSHTPWRSYGV